MIKEDLQIEEDREVEDKDEEDMIILGPKEHNTLKLLEERKMSDPKGRRR